ncbi:DNA-processing protein DprA [Kribbella sp. NBC_01505]|uniref:DNA-processing protein DprA n=1 Tax=Kribbella sp. NBC_01505 TaxID=2903580 RepID=UPI003864D84D
MTPTLADDSTPLVGSAPPATSTDGSGGAVSSTAAAIGEGGETERLARVGLGRVIEPGDLAALKVFEGVGVVEMWQRLRRSEAGTERWATRMAAVEPARDLERAAAIGARFVIPGDDEWPEQVEVLAEAGQLTRRAGVPFGMWVRGPAHLRKVLERSVAIVGARACSSYGSHVAGELAAGLSSDGYTVVSGGAYGIDAAAHRGALAVAGTTVAVLACGVDKSYPQSNSALFSRIVEQGLVVSELSPGCSPSKLRFLARNRLIAAASQGTLVVEAAVRSGALNSAGWAEQCGRPVMAVPGPITSRMSEGSHMLIRERDAVLVTDVPEIIEAVSPLGSGLTSYRHSPRSPIDDLPHDLRRTLDAVPVRTPVPTERIAVTAGLDLPTTQAALEALAALHLVHPSPTGWCLTLPTTD